MTQSNPTPGLGLPQVARRSPRQVVYRVQQSGPAVAFATARVLGLWVPAEAFRRGTVIRWQAHCPTNSTVFILSIGGPGSTTINQGVTSTWTGPAAAGYNTYTLTQSKDGIIPTMDSGGFWGGATGLAVTSGTITPFIQPLNWVQVATNGTFNIVGAVLEVIVPNTNYRPAGESFTT
jgi:hypothetical protein